MDSKAYDCRGIWGHEESKLEESAVLTDCQSSLLSAVPWGMRIVTLSRQTPICYDTCLDERSDVVERCSVGDSDAVEDGGM